MTNWWKRKIVLPLIGFLKTGLSPARLSASITIGILFGIIPSIGVSTFLLSAIGLKWRLNIPVMQVVSYALYPLQLILLIPFLRAGAIVAGESVDHLTAAYIFEYFENDFTGAFAELIWVSVVAVGIWAGLSLLAAYPIFWSVHQFIKSIWRKENGSKTEA